MEQKSNGKNIIGRTAAVSAVFILVAMITMVLPGCQNGVEKETETTEATEKQVQSDAHNDETAAQPEYDSGTQPVTEPQEEPVTDEEDKNDEKDEAEKKEPPEGWELTLASEDWGLSFGEPGTQSRGMLLHRIWRGTMLIMSALTVRR